MEIDINFIKYHQSRFDALGLEKARQLEKVW